MPDHRRHRGPHPQDHHLFSPDQIPTLQNALADFSLLLTRRYATPSAIKLVGDRYSLTERQRTAVTRASCSDAALSNRKKSELPLSAIANQPLLIDGYNILTTLETALSGGPILSCRDGCFRDMAGIHGTYRRVEETIPALHLLADFLNTTQSGPITILLDAPVSNSGRLKALIHDANQNWKIDLVPDPDPLLSASPDIIITADSVILDACARWTNLARALISARIPDAWIADLSPTPITDAAQPPAAPQ
ncbi:MAG TPA: DUF434 domain-containing protein [Tepidisphaeraceae bacterium]|nr:DUF434 domain-containing protein [Tepidisphaeraceae bacterium]